MKTFILIFVLLISTCLYSTIINVPADQPTIQAGINVSVDADTVLVQPGTYVENINYNGKNITIASLFLTTQDTTYISQTIIDGNQNGTVVSFENGETTGALLSGFTITNGSGGGIGCVYNSYPRLENLVITGNTTEYNGGGILCGAYASPNLENVIISNNSAGGNGGGIFCYNYCSPSLENVTISNNTSQNGGGIFCFENCPANLDNVIINNNSANSDGGGILCAVNSNMNLQDVTLTGNTAADEGGGIYCYDNSNPLLINSILWNDTPQEVYFSQGGVPNSIMISYTDIEGGEAGIVTNNNGTINWLEGNIDADPLFVDPLNGDYHLSWANFPIPDETKSPCIDAGDPESPLDPDETIADIGAFYFDQNQQGVEDPQILPINCLLYQNYPNPFNPSTKINYSLKENSKVSLNIYNIKGQKVRQLVSDQLSAGQHSVIWNGKDDNGKAVSSGIYFYKLKADNYTNTKRMILLK